MPARISTTKKMATVAKAAVAGKPIGRAKGVRVGPDDIRAAAVSAAVQKAASRIARGTTDAKRAATNAKATDRAAGPYGLGEQPAVAEILARHPAPRTWKAVQITPDMAKQMLTRNEGNRPLSHQYVADLADQMTKGRWCWTHQGLAFDRKGMLQDGQHRLLAVVNSGVTITVPVSAGCEPTNFQLIDAGRRRTPAQTLAMLGYTDSAMVAGAGRLLYMWRLHGVDMMGARRGRLASDELADLLADMDRETLTAAVRAAGLLYRETGTSRPGTCAALYRIYERAGRAVEPVREFLEIVGKGLHTDDNPAARVLRRYLLLAARVGGRRKLPPDQAMAMILKGWNAHVQRVEPDAFRVTGGMKMPDVLPPADGETRTYR